MSDAGPKNGNGNGNGNGAAHAPELDVLLTIRDTLIDFRDKMLGHVALIEAKQAAELSDLLARVSALESDVTEVKRRVTKKGPSLHKKRVAKPRGS